MISSSFRKTVFLLTAVILTSVYISCEHASAKTNATPQPQVKLEPFTGTVEHIFFHPIVVYPEIGFPKSHKGGYICDWFVTLKEFNTIIEELYQRGYVLVSVKDLYEIKNGFPVKKDLMFPAGKKPLIISMDDLNYYPTMQTHGMNKKLIIRNGKIVSLVNTPSGEEKIQENTEVPEVIDSFVEKHPDFSFNGARGMIALTGYNGILGYDTQKTKSPTYESEKAEAIKVVNVLKKHGWEFASHGYRHLQEGHISAEKLAADAQKWRDEVEILTGPTLYHIYPFGDLIKDGQPGLPVLRSFGFRYFFGVSFSSRWSYQETTVYENRIPIDGKYMMGIVSGSKGSKFFDIKKDIDPLRVKYFMN